MHPVLQREKESVIAGHIEMLMENRLELMQSLLVSTHMLTEDRREVMNEGNVELDNGCLRLYSGGGD